MCGRLTPITYNVCVDITDGSLSTADVTGPDTAVVPTGTLTFLQSSPGSTINAISSPTATSGVFSGFYNNNNNYYYYY